jgi:Phosphopantetheine attachment site
MPNHDSVDKIVMEVVQQVLGRTDITAEDNFFDSGGRSILALRVIHRINGILHIKLPIRSLYEARNLRQFAEQICLFAATDEPDAQTRILPQTNRSRLPASFTQYSILTEALQHPNSLQFNLPFSLHIVLSENHIRTYWCCSPARMGMVAMAPDRWTARCKGASFPNAKWVRA